MGSNTARVTTFNRVNLLVDDRWIMPNHQRDLPNVILMVMPSHQRDLFTNCHYDSKRVLVRSAHIYLVSKSIFALFKQFVSFIQNQPFNSKTDKLKPMSSNHSYQLYYSYFDKLIPGGSCSNKWTSRFGVETRISTYNNHSRY